MNVSGVFCNMCMDLLIVLVFFCMFRHVSEFVDCSGVSLMFLYFYKFLSCLDVSVFL